MLLQANPVHRPYSFVLATNNRWLFLRCIKCPMSSKRRTNTNDKRRSVQQHFRLCLSNPIWFIRYTDYKTNICKSPNATNISYCWHIQSQCNLYSLGLKDSYNSRTIPWIEKPIKTATLYLIVAVPYKPYWVYNLNKCFWKHLIFKTCKQVKKKLSRRSLERAKIFFSESRRRTSGIRSWVGSGRGCGTWQSTQSRGGTRR